MDSLKYIFSQSAHWQLNKEMTRAFGIEASVLIIDLVDKWLYHGSPEWIYNTIEDTEADTTLTRYKQEKAIKILVKYGFIETKLSGTPAKRHFKIMTNKIAVFLQTRMLKTVNLDCKKITTINNKKNNNKIKNIEIDNYLKSVFLENGRTEENHRNDNFLMQKKKKNNSKFTDDDFKKALLEAGADVQHIEDWLEARRTRKLPTTLTALKGFLNECEQNEFPVAEAVRIAAENSWGRFKVSWVKKLNTKRDEKQNHNNRKSGHKASIGSTLDTYGDYSEFT